MAKEVHSSKLKFNISWISVVVIFVGAIVYVPVLHFAEKERQVIYYKVPVIVSTENVISPKVEKDIQIEKSKPLITKELRIGDSDPEVKSLQKFLNSRGFTVAESGPGSPGMETNLFGRGTEEALIRFQEANAETILLPFGLEKGTGIVGELTRKLINS